MKATPVPIAIRLYILKVFIFKADHAHLKNSDPIIKRIGIVKTKEIMAIRGITILDHGKTPGKKSYSIKRIIGRLNSADRLNLLHRYFVSFFLLAVSSTLCFSSWITHVYHAASTALIIADSAISPSTLTIACAEEKFTFACWTPGTFLSDFSISNAQELQCIPSISMETI